MSALSLDAAAREGDGVFLIEVASGRRWTYRAMRDRARDVGRALRARGVRVGDRVTLRATNRVESAVAMLAMLDRGVVTVPLHPRLSDAEAEALRARASAAAHLDDADLDGTNLPGDDLPLVDGDLAAMLFTSGTSGSPRGALLPHDALRASAEASALNLGWTPSDRWLLCLPLCHVGGLSVLTRCLLARRTVLLLPRFDVDAVLDAVTGEGATLLSVVPTMLHALLERDGANALASLRAVLSGGAATSMALREACASRGVSCLATYGLTEACSQVATQRPAPSPRARPGVGPALSALSLRVVDASERDLPAGDIGRIVLRGKAMMRGYDGAAPLDGEWFDTGDHGALDERGELTVHGRRTDLIVTGGENVYPLEVELAVAAHPDVAEALVFGVADPVWGQRVAMLLVPRGALDLMALDRWLRARVAGFKRPRLVAVVPALPTLPSGKPDRLRAAAAHVDALRPW